MVESVEDFMKEFKELKTPEAIEARVQELLSLNLTDMTEALSKWTQENSDELATEFGCIAPKGDWGLMMDEQPKMSAWFKSEGHKPEHWKLEGFSSTEIPNLIGFGFANVAVDDGDVCSGVVYVTLQGKIKHAFAKGD